VAELTECAGRVMAVGIAGPMLDPATRRTLERLQPGAVVLFRRNIVDPHQLRALTDELHRLPSRPLLAIDHEGGQVNRLPAPFTEFPTAGDIGRATVDDAAAVGRAIGRELASAGIDINFAPVLDVASAAGNFLGNRTFAAQAAAVAAAAVAFARGMLESGVLPCGKHFPGHGSTTADSHVARPVVTRSLAELEAVDLVPFRAAIQAGVPILMTAHVLYPALDPEAIATLSPRIAGDLLRRRLGFDGVLWSDHLAMGAVRADHTPGAAAVAALNAGVDGILVCGDLDEADDTADGLYRAIDSGQLPARRLRAAATRVAALGARRVDRPPLPLPIDAHQQLADRVRAVAAASRAC
jgi:beta-N-acetylhexosaminidase